MKLFNFLITLTVLLLPSLLVAKVEVRTSSAKIGIQDQLIVTVTFDQETQAIKIESADFANLGRRSSSSSISIINGHYSKEIIQTYVLKPLKKGKLRFKVNIQGKSFGPYQVEVVDGTLRRSSPPSRIQSNPNRSFFDPFSIFKTAPSKLDKNAILFVNRLSKKKLYLNEIAVLNTYIYFDRTVLIEAIKLSQNFSHSGLIFLQMKDLKPVEEVKVIKGKKYRSQLVMRHLIYPIREGKLKIGGSSFKVQMASHFFNRGEIREVGSNPITILVRKVQSNLENNHFGDFSFQAKLSTNRTVVNEPVTLKLEVSGQGNFKALNSPVDDLLKNVLSPYVRLKKGDIKDDYRMTKTTLVGKKIYEYYIIPEKIGNIELNPIRFSSYSPSKKRVASYQRKLPVLVVDQNQTKLPPSFIQPNQKTFLAKEIRYIKTQLEPAASSNWQIFLWYHSIGSLAFLLLCLPGKKIRSRLVRTKKNQNHFINQLKDLKTSSNSKNELSETSLTRLKEILIEWIIHRCSKVAFPDQERIASQSINFSQRNYRQRKLLQEIQQHSQQLPSDEERIVLKILDKINLYDRIYYSPDYQFNFDQEIDEMIKLLSPEQKIV